MSAFAVEEPREASHDIGSVITAMYASISGPAGPRDWASQLELFHPEARMMRTEIDGAGRPTLKIMDRHQYRENTAPFFSGQAFFEVEIKRRVDVFGDIAHVWSAYEARRDPSDVEPERRGLNCIQLIRDASGRWRIVSMLWDNERAGLKLPAL